MPVVINPEKLTRTATAKRGSRPDHVYAVLRLAILEQAIGPGAKLPEDSIGEQLGVSRTGASVARPTIEEARDIFAVRIELERLVVERVCGKLKPLQYKILDDWVTDEERAYRDATGDYIRQVAEFHVILAEMADSPVLLKYIKSLVARSSLILGLYGRPNWPSCNMDEHRSIIAALRDNDGKRAWQTMSEHLDAVLHRALDSGVREADPSVTDVISKYAGIVESA
jgi:DNA-binding GntR family transcriptional regulator